MRRKALNEFKKELQKIIENQNIKDFDDLVHNGCPFSSMGCLDCELYVQENNTSLTGSLETCLLGSIMDIYQDYSVFKPVKNEKAIMARIVLESIKLLAYLEEGK